MSADPQQQVHMHTIALDLSQGPAAAVQAIAGAILMPLLYEVSSKFQAPEERKEFWTSVLNVIAGFAGADAGHTTVREILATVTANATESAQRLEGVSPHTH